MHYLRGLTGPFFMLSICIPIYNVLSEKLIIHVRQQIIAHNIKAEIILYDDDSVASPDDVYKRVESWPEIIVHKASKNLGRSASRNQLAKMASYKYLLFIDADSEILDEHFIKRYIHHIKPEIVCCGGTIYKHQPPEQNYLLRWKYGHQRETIKASERQKHPWQQFTTHHFLIDKNLFLSMGGFCEDIKGYGHEDTLFGYQLKNRNIPVLHIDNPLYHIGLETSQVFLDKSKHAIRNLVRLHEEFKDQPAFINNIRLLKFYQKQKKHQLLPVWRMIYKMFHKLLEKNLTGKNPAIVLFNLYKFSYFAYLIKKNK